MIHYAIRYQITYSHEKIPCIMAQSTDLLTDHEMAMANAVPKLIPFFTISLLFILDSFLRWIRFKNLTLDSNLF